MFQADNEEKTKIAYYHLPGLFEFYELYKKFLPVFYNHREYFYDWCEIGSIYGSPEDCIWGGGREGIGNQNPYDILSLMKEYNISARLTFSNSLLKKEHLSDKRCNMLCQLFSMKERKTNGIIISSDILLNYIKEYYPNYYFVSSTTKTITDFNLLVTELENDDYAYVVPDFRFNKAFDKFDLLSDELKQKVEFLCNECCSIKCSKRKICYENVSRINLGQSEIEHICVSSSAGEGYSFSKAMQNSMFIGIKDIRNLYLSAGFSNFKIEGRSLGSAVVFEMLLYYMAKPEYQILIREMVYLDNMLDLF